MCAKCIRTFQNGDGKCVIRRTGDRTIERKWIGERPKQMTEMKYLHHNSYRMHSVACVSESVSESVSLSLFAVLLWCVGFSLGFLNAKNTVLNAANPYSPWIPLRYNTVDYVSHTFSHALNPHAQLLMRNYTTALRFMCQCLKNDCEQDRRWWKFVQACLLFGFNFGSVNRPRPLYRHGPVMSIEYLGIKVSFLRGHTVYM